MFLSYKILNLNNSDFQITQKGHLALHHHCTCYRRCSTVAIYPQPLKVAMLLTEPYVSL